MGETQAQHDHCVLDPACASRRLFEAISGKWSPLVVMALKDGKKRHGELRRGLGGISQKMLIQTLRNLERNGLVERKDLPRSPAEGRVLADAARYVAAAASGGDLPMVGTAPRGGGGGALGRGRNGVPVRRVGTGYRAKTLSEACRRIDGLASA